MKYLLDTCTLIWWLRDRTNLSERANQIITNSANEIYVSTVTFWEISIKHSLGKLSLLNSELVDLEQLEEALFDMRIGIIGLNEHESLSYHRLPKKDNHKDPFDRMLVWQAICRQFSLISSDKLLEQYRENGLRICW